MAREEIYVMKHLSRVKLFRELGIARGWQSPAIYWPRLTMRTPFLSYIDVQWHCAVWYISAIFSRLWFTL